VVPFGTAVTTAHDADRGGNPQLILAMGVYPREGDRPTVFQLLDDVTTTGAGADCDIRLLGFEPLHAEIRHDDEEECVLKRIGSTADTRVYGAPVQSAILRRGWGVDLGEWHLSFFREKHADDGRPYGGRFGGEPARQRSPAGRVPVQRDVQGRR
jgi:hypothetical protein